MPRSARLQAALRKLKNPYASLQFEDAGAEPGELRSEIPSMDLPAAAGTLTQSDFEQRARAIFRPYIPAEEHGRLRPHYREFIERNKSRSPQVRFKVIGQLRRYDLSDLGALNPLFNREKEAFTREKLIEIETHAGSIARDENP